MRNTSHLHPRLVGETLTAYCCSKSENGLFWIPEYLFNKISLSTSAAHAAACALVRKERDRRTPLRLTIASYDPLSFFRIDAIRKNIRKISVNDNGKTEKNGNNYTNKTFARWWLMRLFISVSEEAGRNEKCLKNCRWCPGPDTA